MLREMEEERLVSPRSRSARASRALRSLFLAVALAAGFLAASGSVRADAPAGVKATPKPVDLTTGSLSKIRKTIKAHRGAPLLLNVWATWCEPCVDELPDLAGLETRFASAKVKVLGVSSDLILEDDSPELREKVIATLREAGVGYPNVLYKGSADPLLEAFELPGSIPYSILYDADGHEVWRWSGRIRLPDLEKAIAGLPKRP